MRIIWSDEAVADYHQNIQYLLNEWSPKVALEFINDVEKILELIKKKPKLYPLTEYPRIRKAIIRKQVSLFYTFEGDIIQLVRFWNNYQNPEKIKLT